MAGRQSGVLDNSKQSGNEGRASDQLAPRCQFLDRRAVVFLAIGGVSSQPLVLRLRYLGRYLPIVSIAGLTREIAMVRTVLRNLIRMAITIQVALLPSLASGATDYTDMWFNASESGWGVNFTQDYNGPIFATFFVYAANGTPTWVFAVLAFDPANGTYSGTLYETSGGAPLTSQGFDSTTVQAEDVGTATFTPMDAANGTLAYSYRGSAVIAKQITREPLYTANTVANATFLSFTAGGTAFASIIDSRNNGQCSANYPAHQTILGSWRIFPTAVTSNSISFNIGSCDANAVGCVISAPICSFTGAITQTGRLLGVRGSLNCTDGHGFSGGLNGVSTATFYEIAHTDAGVTGKLLVTAGSCNVQSTFLIQRNDWLASQLP